LRNGYYPNIVAALASGDPYTYASYLLVAEQITKWGTPHFADLYLSDRTGGATNTPPPGPQGPVSPPKSDSSHQIGTAWMTLMRTLAHRVPADLATQSAARARIRRAVR
jgi:hypothetical protein